MQERESADQIVLHKGLDGPPTGRRPLGFLCVARHVLAMCLLAVGISRVYCPPKQPSLWWWPSISAAPARSLLITTKAPNSLLQSSLISATVAAILYRGTSTPSRA